MRLQRCSVRFAACAVSLVALSLLPARIADAQRGTRERSIVALDGRASVALRAQVSTLADSISRTGLPAAPLIDKALEGISKGADDRRIMIAVRAVATDLGVARTSLGAVSDAELSAGVAALRAGAGADGITRLRRALPGRNLVVPLSVLASVMVDGAPAASAVVAVAAAAQQRNDVGVLAYGRAVSHDIASGVTPAVALTSSFTATTAAALRPGALPAPIPTLPKIKP